MNGTPNDQSPRARIAVIYDTSFLMKDQPLLTEEWLTDVEKRWYAVSQFQRPYHKLSEGDRDEVNSVFEDARPTWIELSHFVPAEVEEEISDHFRRPDTEVAARTARKRVVRLIEKHACKEPILKDTAAADVPSDATLGADSATDRRLMGYAMALYQSGNYDFVILATDDGGIMYDITQLGFERNGEKAIVCVSHPRDPDQTDFLYPLLTRMQGECVREYHQSEGEKDRRFLTCVIVLFCITAAVLSYFFGGAVGIGVPIAVVLLIWLFAVLG